MRRKMVLLGAGWVAVLGIAVAVYAVWPRLAWSDDEIATLKGLWIGSLPALPSDPSNAVANDPRAATLGHQLFFDTRFSSTGTVACASCHVPTLDFQDGVPLGQGVGTMNRRTMPLAGTAYSPWLFWDGRKDSQWAQALGPLESAVEHGGNRTQYAHLIATHYRAEYEALFGPLPDLSDRTRFPLSAGPVDDPTARAAWEAMTPEDQQIVTRIYVNLGKVIAAYERLLMPGPSRFDQYVDALVNGDTATMQTALTPDEVAGARLFIGKANCTSCHTGPLLTNNDFHNTGVPAVAGLPDDTGRALGAQQVIRDEFNCLSQWSDAKPEDCAELRFLKADGHELERQYKPPSLRDVAERAPYMHAGQFATLREVLEHYNRAPEAPAGHSELEPLNLSDTELAQLEAFLGSLSAPLSAPPEFLQAPEQQSACLNCHPAEDDHDAQLHANTHP
jgi:cytochrome c peroxidase